MASDCLAGGVREDGLGLAAGLNLPSGCREDRRGRLWHTPYVLLTSQAVLVWATAFRAMQSFKVLFALRRYKREGRLDLTATLYLPPGYDKDRGGRLPCLLWAYPREFKTKVETNPMPAVVLADYLRCSFLTLKRGQTGN